MIFEQVKGTRYEA